MLVEREGIVYKLREIKTKTQTCNVLEYFCDKKIKINEIDYIYNIDKMTYFDIDSIEIKKDVSFYRTLYESNLVCVDDIQKILDAKIITQENFYYIIK